MKKKLNGPNGISIRVITSKIRKELTNNDSKVSKHRTLKNSSKSGTIQTSDLKNLSLGLQIVERIMHEGFQRYNESLQLGKKDISKSKKNIISYKSLMQDFIYRLSAASKTEFFLKERLDSLADYSQIAQAARDGIILKQEKGKELHNGKEKEYMYDTSMSVNEVLSTFDDYERESSRLTYKKLENYLGIGLGLVATLGSISKSAKDENNNKSKGIPLITIGTITISGLKLLYGLRKTDYKENLWNLRNEESRTRHDLLHNEQVSSTAEKLAIQNIESIISDERKLEHKLENDRFAYSICLDLATAIISGAYINKKVRETPTGKIDGKSLAEALLSLQAAKSIGKDFIDAAQGIFYSRRDEEEFQKTCQKVNQILKQMDEKVYPLKGATHSFNSISIHDFNGNFYPKKNYDTGEINYSMTLNIPEFSMKRGDVVLLSGESGSGKSTFLRFLKRGDINNRNAIQLDNCEMVDNLGSEFISFRPSIDLGNETNVLFQITGKKNLSDLSPAEQTKLNKMLQELKFDSPNFLEQLSSKKFMEFSTGQQRRLALSKMLYSIDDNTSIVIVDEPVGNVENSLIREQLKMITRYAEEKNVMLLLTTHRLELAEDLATKRYNITKDGTLEQIPIKHKEQYEEFSK